MDFGFFEWMPYEGSSEDFEKYREYQNKIPKHKIVEHMECLKVWRTSLKNEDHFTHVRLDSGVIEDGDFVFPLDFIHYLKDYDIGVPPEYEAYLNTIM